MVISLGKEADSTMIVVQSAPGQPISKQVYDSKVAALNRLEKSTSRVVEIADRLTEADEIIAKVEAQLKNIEGAEADSLLKLGKGMADSIKKIRNFIFGTPHEKQGYGGPYEVTVNGRLYDAKGEILAKNKIPDVQEFTLIEMAEKVVVEAVQKSNSFFNSQWKQYQQKADATPMKIFKDFKDL
jgi:fructose-specific phosphotransferase system component IIB